jgi:hypothetical protein
MKKINSKFGLFALAAILVVCSTVISCKKKFDEPPTFVDPNISATITVKQLKAMHTVIGAFDTIKTDQVLVGVVVGDDKSGNLYKSISIQDATGGISLRLDAPNLYTTYPVGRKLYIKLKGLVLGDYGGMTQIGGGIDNSDPTRPGLAALASIFFEKYIIPGSLNNPVPIKTIADLSLLKTDLQDTFQNTLIRLENFEFAVGDTNKTYGDPTRAASALNFTIKNCAGQSIVLRNSSYATFSSAGIPNGNGTIVALYTFFNGTKQLTLRDTSDIQFNGARCGAANPNLQVKTIQQIRALYTGAAATIPANTGIEGTIVSNVSNEAAGNYRIQDASGYGIQIRFVTSGNPNAALGDKYLVDLSGLTLDVFNGDLQVNNVGSATKTGAGSVVPRVTTVSAINANLAGSATNNWSSTVVTLNNVTITQTSTNTTGANYNVTDATGTIVTFIRAALGYTPPAAATSITGYVSLFNGTPQITIRNASDVLAGTVATATVSTTAISGVTQTAAASGGNVTAGGTSAVTARGVVWSTSPNPTVSLSTKTTDGSGTGTFTSSITGLTASTTYYVRAYATNASGTAYGNEVSFTTQSTSGATTTTENFETGLKTGYTAASVALNSGSWFFSDALLGTAAGSDVFNGAQSARIRGTVGSNNGYIQTEFGINGLKNVKVTHAQTNFNEGTGTITPSFELYISKDNGNTWTKVGSTTATNKGTFTTTTFTVNAAPSESVRVRILNTSSASISAPTNQVRINVDDVVFES